MRILRGSCWGRRNHPGAFGIGRAMKTWGSPSCLMNWNVKKDQNAEKKQARALEQGLGAQDPWSAGPASWPLLMRPEDRGGSPCLPSRREPSQSRGSPGCVRPPPQTPPHPCSRKSRNLAPAQPGSPFCIVRAPGEVRTWSCPNGGLRACPENHESTA